MTGKKEVKWAQNKEVPNAKLQLKTYTFGVATSRSSDEFNNKPNPTHVIHSYSLGVITGNKFIRLFLSKTNLAPLKVPPVTQFDLCY